MPARLSVELSWSTLILLALLIPMLMIVAPGNALAQNGFGEPVPGQHIYDRAGLLTDEEIADLENRAEAVEEAGAPVVVYLQARSVEEGETEEDARNLMDAWDIQSEPGARDGVVIFLNLEPDNLRRGDVFIFAGEAHYDGGNLPRSEVERIVNEEMLPYLRDDETAEGIGAALDEIAHSLIFGPPPPTAFEQAVDNLTESPLSALNLVAVAFSAVFAGLAYRVWSARPRSHVPVVASTYRPDDLHPTHAGALVSGRVSDAQMEATVLVLGQKGALAIEPGELEKQAQVRLIDGSKAETEIEREVWQALEIHADDGIVAHENLTRVRNDWSNGKDLLKRDLIERDWYDPNATSRRLPAYLAGSAGLALALVALILTIMAGNVWALVGTGLLAVVGVTAIIIGFSVPDTTPLGESVAVEWRSYLEGLRRSQDNPVVDSHLVLDEAMPYVVAMNETGALKRRLEEASKKGYAPAWLGPSMRRHEQPEGGFFIYWTAFHSGLYPTSSGSSSGGGGGASAGGGGAGGRF